MLNPIETKCMFLLFVLEFVECCVHYIGLHLVIERPFMYVLDQSRTGEASITDSWVR